MGQALFAPATQRPPPVEKFVPAGDLRRQFTPIRQLRIVDFDWVFDAEDQQRLAMGHAAEAMEDKWNIFEDEDREVHFHRSWTGCEIYRIRPLRLPFAEEVYGITAIDVESDAEVYNCQGEHEILRDFAEVLRFVLGVVIDATSSP